MSKWTKEAPHQEEARLKLAQAAVACPDLFMMCNVCEAIYKRCPNGCCQSCKNCGGYNMVIDDAAVRDRGFQMSKGPVTFPLTEDYL